MNSRELFALFLRIVGVLGIIYVIRRIEHQEAIPPVWLIIRLVYLAIGAYFIRGAPWLLKFAYPDQGGEATAPKN